MNSEKIKTLEQLHDAIDIVENARAIPDLSPAERLEIEKASVKLRNLERSIIRIKSTELVSSLTSDAESLLELATEMKASVDKLAGISSAIEKAAGIVGAFVNIVKSAAAAGLI